MPDPGNRAPSGIDVLLYGIDRFFKGIFPLKPVVAGKLTCGARSSSCPNLMPWETTVQACRIG